MTFSNIMNEYYPFEKFAITYDTIFLLSVICLIFLPFLTYMKEIDKNDPTGQSYAHSIRGKIIVFVIALVLGTLCCLHSVIIYIFIKFKNERNPEVRNAYLEKHNDFNFIEKEHSVIYHTLFISFSREPLYLGLSVIQDYIDRLIKVTSVESESENARFDPLSATLTQ